MEIQALTRNARMSPKKVREVARLIQGRPVNEAIDFLTLIPRKSSRLLVKTLKSAVANAENNNSIAADQLTVHRALIENVTFADHSLATDSVFAETHFISCRNVMIYFNRRLQNRVLSLFHESLCHRGFLGLGSKESIDFSTYAQRFEPLAKRERIFRKVAA